MTQTAIVAYWLREAGKVMRHPIFSPLETVLGMGIVLDTALYLNTTSETWRCGYIALGAVLVSHGFIRGIEPYWLKTSVSLFDLSYKDRVFAIFWMIVKRPVFVIVWAATVSMAMFLMHRN